MLRGAPPTVALDCACCVPAAPPGCVNTITTTASQRLEQVEVADALRRRREREAAEEVGARLQREVRRLEVVVVGDLDAHEVAQRVGLALQARPLREVEPEELGDRARALAEREVDLRVARARLAQRGEQVLDCLLYTSPSPRDGLLSRMPSSA